ncbi:MAG: serine hydrolase domain-containing protein [Fidelibacterota bacterium]
MNKSKKRIHIIAAAGIILAGILIVNCAKIKQNKIDDRILSVEQGLRPAMYAAGKPVPAMNINERMAHHKVHGLSVAVIHKGKVEWEKGYGVVAAESQDSVTSETLFQAASISKPVAALAALHLVERGELDMDIPVNQQLRSWKVPENEFTKEEKVTLRRLLNHTAGLTVHGFPGYHTEAEQPAVVAILDGESPCNTSPVRVDKVPGTGWRYSGGGYTVAQLLMTDILNQPFAEFMKSKILLPAGMRGSTFEQPLPPEKANNAAAGHRSDGNIISGKWHVYPELTAAGLWSTAGDLCRFAVAVQKAAAGDSELLTQKTALEMLTPGHGNWGLGPAIAGAGKNRAFSHGGGNMGYRCQLYAFVENGQGAAVMTNSNHGSDLAAEILRGIASVYDWPAYRAQPVTVIDLPEDSLTQFTGDFRYDPQPQLSFMVTLNNGRLLISSPPVGELNLVPVSRTEFVELNNGYRVSFIANDKGKYNRMKAVPFDASMELLFTRKEVLEE